jgi:hypothetical protein
MKKIFKSSSKEYEKHNGEVEVIRKLTGDENECSDYMYECLSSIGKFHAFKGELTDKFNIHQNKKEGIHIIKGNSGDIICEGIIFWGYFF